jgi:hypothetical protein
MDICNWPSFTLFLVSVFLPRLIIIIIIIIIIILNILKSNRIAQIISGNRFGWNSSLS